jgi:hypothetical protein
MQAVPTVLLAFGMSLVVACAPSTSVDVPTGLAGDHVLFANDYIVHHPDLVGVYDPRIMTLTADGTLVLERGDLGTTLATTATKLDDDGLAQAWSSIVRSGVFSDGTLELPGFASRTVTTATNVIHIDDGTRSSRLVIDDLGSEQIFPGEPRIPGSEMSLREAATRLMDELRALGGSEPWTPPALTMWWRPELPADSEATIVPWSLPIDLASAGRPADHPVWERCVRLDGEDAAAVADVAHSLPVGHVVEQAGSRFVLGVRPIHPDELDEVDCP